MGNDQDNQSASGMGYPINDSLFGEGDTSIDEEDSRQFQVPQGNDRHIAIWGTTQTGKTVYIATLWHALTRSAGQDNIPKWKMLARRSSQTWINEIYNNMIQNAQFPQNTAPGQHHFPSFRITDEQDNDKFQLTFIDAAGEMYNDPDAYALTWGLNMHPYEYLRMCSGLLLLLDPIKALDGDDSGFGAIINTLIALSLSPHDNVPRPIQIPVALCITKCDDPRCRDATRSNQAAADFAAATFGDALVGHINQYCTQKEWFACSALGFKDGQPSNVIQRWDGTDGIRDTRQIAPRNIAQPVVWLSERLASSNGNGTPTPGI